MASVEMDDDCQVLYEPPVQPQRKRARVPSSHTNSASPDLQSGLSTVSKVDRPRRAIVVVNSKKDSIEEEDMSDSPGDDSDYREEPDRKSKAARSKSVSPKKDSISGSNKTASRKKRANSTLPKDHTNVTKSRVRAASKKEPPPQDFKSCKAALAKLKIELAATNSALAAKEKELAESKKRGDKLQSEHLTLLSKGKLQGESDTDVDKNCDAIFDSIKDLAHDSSIQDWSDLSSVQLKEVLSLLETETRKRFVTAWVRRDIEKNAIPPFVVLNALLNRELCAETFEKPFAHLISENACHSGTKTEAVMKWIMETAEKKSPNASYKLRATILRAIDTSIVTKMGKATLPEIMPASRAKRCDEIVSTILQRLSVLFKVVPEDEREERNAWLHQVVEKAIRLSCTLSTQYPKIEFQFLGDLGEPKFQVKDHFFLPHRALNFGEDNHPGHQDPGVQALVGKSIDMVVVPVVRRWGDKDGEDYHQERVLYQGSIWMVTHKGYTASGNILPQTQANVKLLEELSVQGTAAQRLELGNKTQPAKQPHQTTQFDTTNSERDSGEGVNPPSSQEKPYEFRSSRTPTKKARQPETEKFEQKQRPRPSESSLVDPQKLASAAGSVYSGDSSEMLTLTSNDGFKYVKSPTSRAGASTRAVGAEQTFNSMDDYFAYYNKTKTGVSTGRASTPPSRKRKALDDLVVVDVDVGEDENEDEEVEVLAQNTANKKQKVGVSGKGGSPSNTSAGTTNTHDKAWELEENQAQSPKKSAGSQHHKTSKARLPNPPLNPARQPGSTPQNSTPKETPSTKRPLQIPQGPTKLGLIVESIESWSKT